MRHGMWEFAWYVIVGFVAGVLDYSAGVGFGLVASVLLVSLSGVDPRLAASITSLVQIVNAVPATLGHYRRGNINISRHYIRISIIIIISSSLGSLISIFYYVKLPLGLVKYIFSATVLVIMILSWISYLTGPNTRTTTSRRGSLIAGIGGFVAGVEKAVSGGGFSVVLVLIQKAAGIDIRSAIAGLPVVKLIPFSIIATFYISSGFFDLILFSFLFFGALLSTLVAPRLLKRIDDTTSLLIITGLTLLTLISLLFSSFF